MPTVRQIRRAFEAMADEQDTAMSKARQEAASLRNLAAEARGAVEAQVREASAEVFCAVESLEALAVLGEPKPFERMKSETDRVAWERGRLMETLRFSSEEASAEARKEAEGLDARVAELEGHFRPLLQSLEGMPEFKQLAEILRQPPAYINKSHPKLVLGWVDDNEEQVAASPALAVRFISHGESFSLAP